MKLKKFALTTIVFFAPIVTTFIILSSIISADAGEDVYSVYIIAGQSQAEGSNTFRNNLLTTGDNLYQQNYTAADSATKFWWAGANGLGLDANAYLSAFFGQEGQAGWVYSGGGGDVTGASRMKTLAEGQRYAPSATPITLTSQKVGPEYGIGRSLYDQGRRKVIILKVSYGFQSLFKTSTAPPIPFDWNTTSTNKSYDELKDQFTKLTNYITSPTGLNAKYTVDGFFWHQGGTDTLQQNYTDAYKNNFIALTNAIKTDFKLHPDAKIVAAKIGYQWCLDYSNPNVQYFCSLPWTIEIDPDLELASAPQLISGTLGSYQPAFAKRLNIVRNAIQDVADSKPWIKTMEVGDASRSADNLHYDEAGQIKIGNRFTKMYRMPYRIDGASVQVGSNLRTETDFDGDGISNFLEDTGNATCNLVGTQSGLSSGGANANDGNLGNDDCDGDGFPNYLDIINGLGSGL